MRFRVKIYAVSVTIREKKFHCKLTADLAVRFLVDKKTEVECSAESAASEMRLLDKMESNSSDSSFGIEQTFAKDISYMHIYAYECINMCIGYNDRLCIREFVHYANSLTHI